jgi:hypothetical protein
VPEDNVSAGDTLTIQCTVTDDTLVEPFVNVVKLRVMEKEDRGGGEAVRKRRKVGSGDDKGGEGDEVAGLATPEIIQVKEGDPNYIRHKFDELTACKVIEDADGPAEEERSTFTFYVNVDNRYLGTEIKNGKGDPKAIQAKFVYGNVLTALALIHDRKSRNGKNGETENSEESEEVEVTKLVETTTRAMAPFLIPMIDHLGAITPEEVSALGQIGDDE